MPTAPLQFAYLRPKLHPPRLTDDILVRERLLRRLGYRDALTLVVAPAGYGKTTLAATWLARAPWPGAWLTLDSTDSNLALFLTGLVAAVRSVFPEFGDEVLELLGAPLELTADLVLPLLLDTLHRLDRPFALVLDDYHAITSTGVHQVLTGIAAYPPAALHLLLCTRHDPPLPPRVRTAGTVNEVRMPELSFTQEETAEFLALSLAHPLDQETAPALTQQVEGWPAALRLVAIMARQGRDISHVDAAVRVSGSQLMDYLAAEVIRKLPDEMQAFVERTAILQRLSGPLCAAVMGMTDAAGQQAAERRSAEALRRLEQDGLFLVNVDEADAWYRYHALFRTLMQERLRYRSGAQEIENLHRRAAAWYETQGMLDDALYHLLALADPAEAISLVNRHWPHLLHQTDFRRLEHWVNLFPAPVVNASPDLLLIHGWLSNYYYDLESIATCCRRVEELSGASFDPAVRDEWLGNTKSLTAIRCVYTHDAAGAIGAARAALDLLPSEKAYARGMAVFALAIGLQMVGRSDELAAYLDSLRREPGLPHDLLELRCQQASGYIFSLQGDLPSLHAAGVEVCRLAAAREMGAAEGWGHYFLGCACYLRNDLAGACHHFGILVERRYRFAALAAAHGAFGLALTLQALDSPLQANAVLGSVQHYLSLLRSRDLFNASQALAAELALRQGRLEDATRWRRQGATLAPDSSLLLYSAQLAAPKILLAEDSDASRKEAARLLQGLCQRMSDEHNVRCLVEVLVLQVLLHQREYNLPVASAVLEQALSLAAPHGLMRVFIDNAAALRPLLDSYGPPAHLQPFAARVRSMLEFAAQPVFDTTTQAADASPQASAQRTAPMAAPMAAPTSNGRDLRELLTFREMDVLVLLGHRMSNKEIAQVLNVSTATVKQHTVSLYRKLGIANRRQAAVYAGQIDPSSLR